MKAVLSGGEFQQEHMKHYQALEKLAGNVQSCAENGAQVLSPNSRRSMWIQSAHTMKYQHFKALLTVYDLAPCLVSSHHVVEFSYFCVFYETTGLSRVTFKRNMWQTFSFSNTISGGTKHDKCQSLATRQGQLMEFFLHVWAPPCNDRCDVATHQIKA